MDANPIYRLKLFVAGASQRSEAAVVNLRRICAERLPSRCEIEIVDILQHPELAERARILATPTLVRESPSPVRRVVGDLSDEAQVFSGLGLPSNWNA